MKVDVADLASPKLRAMCERVGNLKPLMVMMGHHMENSVRRNFNQGGRPDTWTELKGVTVLPKGTRRKQGSRQRIQGKSRLGGPLVLTGDLRSSIGFTAEIDDLVLWSRPTPAVKAAVHQYGTDRAGRGNATVIPARPFLMFQKDDIEWFRKALAGWVRVGGGGVSE